VQQVVIKEAGKDRRDSGEEDIRRLKQAVIMMERELFEVFKMLQSKGWEKTENVLALVRGEGQSQ
jgi:hypothetical protein